MKNDFQFFGLEKLESDLNRLGLASVRAFLQSGRDLADNYKNAIHFVGAVDTGAAAREVSATEFLREIEITSGVRYEGWIEFGNDRYKGREPAKKALDQFHQFDQLENRFSEEFDRILNR